ncbi:MAG: hypothetical protein OQK56_00870 [Ignavibacteriaceae bacterium]|nr:hypothetical protein [Ignavibacteriaceae bacterium]
MNFKETLYINNFLHRIKLDKSENDFIFFEEIEKIIEENDKDEKFSVSEWNQEYELIYSSYLLEK